jgi:hypothetical protein
MFRVAISSKKDEQKKILRPILEADDAIYWVNRLAEFGYQTEVVREGAAEDKPTPAAPQLEWLNS